MEMKLLLEKPHQLITINMIQKEYRQALDFLDILGAQREGWDAYLRATPHGSIYSYAAMPLQILSIW